MHSYLKMIKGEGRDVYGFSGLEARPAWLRLHDRRRQQYSAMAAGIAKLEAYQSSIQMTLAIFEGYQSSIRMILALWPKRANIMFVFIPARTHLGLRHNRRKEGLSRGLLCGFLRSRRRLAWLDNFLLAHQQSGAFRRNRQVQFSLFQLVQAGLNSIRQFEVRLDQFGVLIRSNGAALKHALQLLYRRIINDLCKGIGVCVRRNTRRLQIHGSNIFLPRSNQRRGSWER
jgi:hypothetical protein